MSTQETIKSESRNSVKLQLTQISSPRSYNQSLQSPMEVRRTESQQNQDSNRRKTDFYEINDIPSLTPQVLSIREQASSLKINTLQSNPSTNRKSPRQVIIKKKKHKLQCFNINEDFEKQHKQKFQNVKIQPIHYSQTPSSQFVRDQIEDMNLKLKRKSKNDLFFTQIQQKYNKTPSQKQLFFESLDKSSMSTSLFSVNRPQSAIQKTKLYIQNQNNPNYFAQNEQYKTHYKNVSLQNHQEEQNLNTSHQTQSRSLTGLIKKLKCEIKPEAQKQKEKEFQNTQFKQNRVADYGLHKNITSQISKATRIEQQGFVSLKRIGIKCVDNPAIYDILKKLSIVMSDKDQQMKQMMDYGYMYEKLMSENMNSQYKQNQKEYKKSFVSDKLKQFDNRLHYTKIHSNQNQLLVLSEEQKQEFFRITFKALKRLNRDKSEIFSKQNNYMNMYNKEAINLMNNFKYNQDFDVSQFDPIFNDEETVTVLLKILEASKYNAKLNNSGIKHSQQENDKYEDIHEENFSTQFNLNQNQSQEQFD